MLDAITSFRGTNRFLSNFYPSPFEYGNFLFQTNEHFYQAMKATNQTDLGYVISAPVPHEAKKIGRQITCRSDWDMIKLEVMETGLRAKFQIPHLASQLVQTGDAYLQETNNWGDTYWGVYNGQGENHLGQLLMKIRSEL